MSDPNLTSTQTLDHNHSFRQAPDPCCNSYLKNDLVSTEHVKYYAVPFCSTKVTQTNHNLTKMARAQSHLVVARQNHYYLKHNVLLAMVAQEHTIVIYNKNSNLLRC